MTFDLRRAGCVLSSLLLWCCSQNQTAPTSPFVEAFDLAPPSASTDSYLCGQPTNLPRSTLIDTGHRDSVITLHQTHDRLLSQSRSRWVLWNTQTRSQVASGDIAPNPRTGPDSDLVGDIVFVPVDANSYELRAAKDGHLLGSTSIQHGPRTNIDAGLAVDGSYAWSLVEETLRLWSTEGRTLATVTVPKSVFFEDVFADRAQLRFVRVPNNAPDAIAIETIGLDGKSKGVSSVLTGEFVAWFTDGRHLITREENQLHVYASDGSQIQTLAVPATGDIGGHGNFFWISLNGATLLDPVEVRVYRLGSADPVMSFTGLTIATPSRSGIVGFVQQAQPPTLWQLDLRSDTPQLIKRQIDSLLSMYGSSADGGWSASVGDGSLYLSPSTSASEPLQRLGCGEVLATAGSASGLTAVATREGKVRVFDPQAKSSAPVLTLEQLSSGLALSSDGHSLAVQGQHLLYPRSDDQSIHVIALPSGTVLHSWPSKLSDPETQVGVALSADGQRIARRLCSEATTLSCSIQVDRIDGTQVFETPVLTARNPASSDRSRFAFSPNGARLALTVDYGEYYAETFIQDAATASSIAGSFEGWIDDDHFIRTRREDATPLGIELVDVHGTIVRTLPFGFLDAECADKQPTLSAEDAQLRRTYLQHAGRFAGDKLICQSGPQVKLVSW